MDGAKLAWAQAQPVGSDARTLASAYASGVRIVRHSDGRQIEYRTQAELGAAIEALYTAVQPTTSRRPGVTYAGFTRGW